MKKITVICRAEDRQTALETLRSLGVLHLSHVRPPAGRDVTSVRERLKRAETVSNLLAVLPHRVQQTVSQPELQALPAGDVIERAMELIQRKHEINESLTRLRAEEASLEPYGDFDPALIRTLAEKGIFVRLFHVPGRDMPPVPKEVQVFVIRRDQRGMRVAVVGAPNIPFGGRELPTPARSLSAVRTEMDILRREAGTIESELAVLARHRPLVDRYVRELKGELMFAEAAAGMGSHRSLAYLQGFCPVDKVDCVRKAGAEGWGLVVEDPAPDDAVPTLIRNSAWVRPIEALFRVIQILPGYREADVSVSFLVFMSIFFAMIIGDAGYGLIYLLATLFARHCFRKAPSEPFKLLTVFSFCTIAWGMLVGAYFGLNAPGPLRLLKISWLDNYHNVMYLCLLLGTLHLTVAHVWNIIRYLNSTRAIAQAGWAAVTWTMFFAANALLLERPFPRWYAPVAILGFIAVALFMTPWNRLKTEWVNHLMLPLTLMSNFGDILSYLRLFALGIAGLQLAAAFNSMAQSLGFASPLRAFVAALIVFVGHALNIVLGALSVFVHGIRLNALEFSTHFGLEWNGIPYRPFGKLADKEGEAVPESSG
ncbi:MAG: hypothetical protein N2255_02990 [Kiritimatiellae bacterium]|nr:hypothetical protein [Kiritimatiellia bacterium]